MRARSSARGPFYGCLNYPNCNGIVNISTSYTPPPYRGNAGAARLRSKFPGRCTGCGGTVAVGDSILYSDRKVVGCMACRPADTGVAPTVVSGTVATFGEGAGPMRSSWDGLIDDEPEAALAAPAAVIPPTVEECAAIALPKIQLDDHQRRVVSWRTGEALVAAAAGCHRKGQKLLMFDGSVKAIEDVAVGDQLMGPDSKPREVLQLIRGHGDMARVVPTKGEPFVVNLDHVLTVERSSNARRSDHKQLVDITVRDHLQRGPTWQKEVKLVRRGVEEFSPSDLSVYQMIEPYFLGMLLGDGSFCGDSVSISKPGEFVRDLAYEQAAKWELQVRIVEREGCPSYFFTRGPVQRGVPLADQRNPLIEELREQGLFGKNGKEKFVPFSYSRGSRECREAILAGLLDADGHLSGGCIDFISVSRQLSEDVAFIARSLGLAAYVVKALKSDQHDTWGTYWRVSISGDLTFLPFRRLKPRPRTQIKDVLCTGFKIEILSDTEDFYGFTLDGDGRYLLEDFTVTHNSGKSTVLQERTAALVREGCAPERIVTLVYNRKAADDLRARMKDRLGFFLGERIAVATFHGWAYTVINQWWPNRFGRGRIVGVEDGPSSLTLALTAIKACGLDDRMEARTLVKLSELSREALIDFEASDAIERVQKLPVPVTADDARSVVMFGRAYQNEKAKVSAIDFADMLYLVNKVIDRNGARARMLAQRYTHVQVDEAQDINPARLRIASHLGSGAKSLIMVGDLRQCQPAGTKVLTPTGERNIEDLRDGDEVRAWIRSDVYVQQQKGSRVRVASRPYAGVVIDVEANGKKTTTTPNHRWVARWSPAAKELHAVYVMGKNLPSGRAYRIGWCKIIDESNGVMNQHFKTRARLEGADSIWLVRVCKSRAEASAYESIYSTRYGIPTVMFNSVGTQLYTEETLNFIWEECGRESISGAKTLLTDVGLNPETPLWTAGGKPGRATLFEITAENLCEGMQVPVFDGERSYTWHDVKLTKRLINEPVYSLDVEDHHAYIADGICTLNSIYGFTGARPDLFKSRLDEGAELLTLPVNRRSTMRIVETGNRIAAGKDWNLGGDCSPAENNIIESAEPVKVWWTESGAEEADAVAAEVAARTTGDNAVPLSTPGGKMNYACLVRTNGQAADLELAFTLRKMPCRVVGSEGGVWASGPGRDFLAYLRVANGEPDKDFAKIANKPKRFIRRNIAEQAALSGNVVAALRQNPDSKGARKFATDIEWMRTLSWEEQVKETLRLLLEDLRERASESESVIEPDEDKAEALSSLADIALQMGSVTAIDAQIEQMRKVKAKDPAVEICTMHKSKGAEWHTVFVCGAAHGVIPHMKAHDVEEERRLFYVAVTRAKSVCVVSVGGPKPSPFLAALLPEGEEVPEETAFATAKAVPPIIRRKAKTEVKMAEPVTEEDMRTLDDVFGAGAEHDMDADTRDETLKKATRAQIEAFVERVNKKGLLNSQE